MKDKIKEELEKEIKKYKDKGIEEITEVTKDGVNVFFKTSENDITWFRNRAKLQQHLETSKSKDKEFLEMIEETDWTDFSKDDLMEEYSEVTQADDFYENSFNIFIADKIKSKLKQYPKGHKNLEEEK